MIVAIQGTSTFDDYNVLLRAMGVAMSTLKQEDSILEIYSAGPGNINAMVSEFVNLSERGLKSRGKKIKFEKVAPAVIDQKMYAGEINFFAFLSKPNERASKLVELAKDYNVDSGVFQY
jgi:hypothetical protein